MLSSPVLCTLLLVRVHLSAGLLDFVPGAVNDETLYWHQILTFAAVGFDGGYYSAHGFTAPVAFSHFYLHGPAFPLLYGLPARWLGWELYSAPLYNLSVLVAGLGAYLALARPGSAGLALLLALLVGFWPMPFFAASNMQASVHQALALGFAGGLARLLACPAPGPPLRARAGFALAVVTAAFLRPTWLLLLLALPAVAGALDGPSRRRLAGLWAGALALAACVGAGVIALSAPLPPFSPELPTTPTNFRDGVGLGDVWWRLSENLALLRDAPPAATGILLEGLALLGFALVALPVAWRSRGEGEAARRSAAELLCHGTSLAGIAGFALFFYDVGDLRGARLVSPHLLLSLALMLALGRRRVVAAFALYQALLLPASLDLADEVRSRSFGFDGAEIEAFRREVSRFVAYDPDAPSPWCNTLLSSELPRRLLGTPPGIGISFLLYRDARVRLPLESRYLLLNSRHREWLEDGRFYDTPPLELALRPLAATSHGGLYENLGAPCGGLRPPGRP